MWKIDEIGQKLLRVLRMGMMRSVSGEHVEMVLSGIIRNQYITDYSSPNKRGLEFLEMNPSYQFEFDESGADSVG